MITSLLSRRNPPSSTDTSNHKPHSSHCATSRDILWIDRYCSTRVGFRCPPFSSSTRPCSGQENSLGLNSTVLHRLALEGTAAGRETQRGTTAIGCFRGPRFGVNITGERMLGVRGVSAAGCKRVRERIAVRSPGCSEPGAWSLVVGSLRRRWWLAALGGEDRVVGGRADHLTFEKARCANPKRTSARRVRQNIVVAFIGDLLSEIIR